MQQRLNFRPLQQGQGWLRPVRAAGAWGSARMAWIAAIAWGASDSACSRQARSWSRDRKSTRLNSSHLGISYAAFCLKKKALRRPAAAQRLGAVLTARARAHLARR